MSVQRSKNRRANAALAAATIALCCIATVGVERSPAAGPVTQWSGTSTTTAITGDISIGNGTIRMAGKSFPFVLDRPLRGVERTDAAAVVSAEVTPGVTAARYRTLIAANTKLLAQNTMCASEAATWIVTVRTPATAGQTATLSLAVFSGNAPPDLDPKSVGNTKTLCGTFLYSAKK